MDLIRERMLGWINTFIFFVELSTDPIENYYCYDKTKQNNFKAKHLMNTIPLNIRRSIVTSLYLIIMQHFPNRNKSDASRGYVKQSLEVLRFIQDAEHEMYC